MMKKKEKPLVVVHRCFEEGAGGDGNYLAVGGGGCMDEKTLVVMAL